jgi:hypothetical protein
MSRESIALTCEFGKLRAIILTALRARCGRHMAEFQALAR